MVSFRVFLRFLATYVLLISLPLAVGTVLTQALVEEYEKKVTESQIALLNQVREGIEALLDDVEWQTYQISGNPKLLRFLSQPGPAAREDTFLLKEIVGDLNSYLLYSNMISSTFYVYCPRQETVLTPYSIYRTRDFEDGKTFFIMNDTGANEWHRTVLGSYHQGTVFPAREVTVEDFKNRELVPYIQSIPVGYFLDKDDVEGAVVFFIGEEEFTGYLDDLGIPEGGYAYVADENGTILTSIGTSVPEIAWSPPPEGGTGAFRSEDQDHFVVYDVSRNNGWRYVAALPTRWAFRAVRQLQRTTFIGLLLSLLLSVGMASVLAYRRSESLGHIFSQIRDVFDSDDQAPFTYQSLDLGVSKLIERNTVMQQELVRQRDLVFSNFLARLLNGYYRTPASLKQFGSYLGIQEENSSYTVVSIGFNGTIDLQSPDVIDQLNKVKVVVKTELQRAFKGTTWIHDPSEERIACVFSGAGGAEDAIAATAQTVDKAGRLYPEGFSTGIGSTVESLVALHRSYSEALEAELYCRHRRIVEPTQFEDIERSLDTYRFPIEVEVRLMNAVIAGDAEAVRGIFDEVVRENFEERNLPDEKTRFLLFEIRSTLAKVITRMKLQPRDYPVRDHGNYRRDVEDIRDTFLRICDLADSRKKSHNSRLIREITGYLDKNYIDRNLSLVSVASEFSITESYLSFFFKEQTGQNFSTYVERLRIEAAARLLVESDASILDVARQSGYNNDKTFRRVFRRVKGMSPTEYKQEHRQRRII